MKKIITLAAFLLVSVSLIFANDYVSIAKNGNVYDDANAKYITVNQNNDNVSVLPGMVFVTNGHTPGWYKIEYSPGLHAFIPEQIVSTSYTPVKPGTYDVKNNPGHKLTVINNGDTWTATSDGKNYKGTKTENVVVFLNDSNNIEFSLVDLGNGPVVMTYDNAVTKFF